MQPCRAGMLTLVLVAVAGCGGDRHTTREVRLGGLRVRVDVDAYRHAGPQRGDVVLVHPPEGASPAVNRCGNPRQPADGHPCDRAMGGPVERRALTRRVAAVGGDWVEIRRNRVYVAQSASGPFVLRDDPGVKGTGRSCVSPLCNLPKPTRVADGTYFLMDDRRERGDDSRRWGPVPPQWIDGKVLGLSI
jgi:signal peptidase I